MSRVLDFGPDQGRRELWLFALHVSNDDIGHWEPPRPDGPPRDWPLEPALGAGPLRPSGVQLFEVDDLGKFGLRRYLTEAHGMDPQEVDADAEELDRLHGTALLLFDTALTRRPGRLDPQRPLRFIGHYRAPASLGPATPMKSGPASVGHIPGPSGPGEDRRRLGRGLALSLGLLALVALALLGWALA